MIKHNHNVHKQVETHHQSAYPTTHPAHISSTEPLRTVQQKRDKKGAMGTKGRDSHQIRIEIVEEERSGKGRGHRRGKSIDLQMVACGSCEVAGAQRSRKIIINSNFIHEMRRRTANSEMKHYPQSYRKKRPSETGKKSEKLIIEINSSHTAPSHHKKNRQISHSLTLSSKINHKQDVQERRCKSSLRDKKHNKSQHEVKFLEKSLPLPSKLNSLYSNTTSIYNSHNDLPLMEQKMSLRIPTEESQEIEEIRKYESVVITRERSIKVIRNARQPLLGKAIAQSLLEPEYLNTEDIITNYLLKLGAESQPEINHPPTLTQIHEMCRKTRPEIQILSEDSLIERLESVSIEEHLGDSEGECSKLNEIMAMIEKEGRNKAGEACDKQQILDAIKEILYSKRRRDQKGERILQMNDDEAGQAIKKDHFDSSSINNSLTSSVASEKDISVLNLEILDKALRERQAYLQNRLRRQLQRMEEEREEGVQVQRVRKWLSHQIKEVHHTRMQLWKGFSVAKNLLKDELCDKNTEMMRCLSEKYIPKSSHSRKERQKQRQQKRKQEERPQTELVYEEWSKLDDAMYYQSSPKVSQQEVSPTALSSLIQQSPLYLQDLRFLNNNDSYQQSPTKSADIASPEQSQSSQRQLRRQRLNCESPHSQSQSESYGAIIIEREDTFLFSSQKKEQISLRDLTVQDKEDICDFLFLDLCIQISDGVGEGRVMHSIRRFIEKMREYSRRQKGFKTNTNSIQEYLTSFIAFLKARPQMLQQIHEVMDKPMGPTTIEILQYMHAHNQETQQQNEIYVLTAKTFDAFEEIYMRGVKLQRYFDDDERQNRRIVFIKNAIHVHNKAVYDAYNETLDKDRPFGIWGEPFSWKKVPKFKHTRHPTAKNELLIRRAQQTIELSHFLCGFMADKEDCPLKDNPNVTVSYLEQVRHDRLSQMMAKEMEESEERMRFFDDEETELLVEMSHSIFRTLVQEVVLLL